MLKDCCKLVGAHPLNMANYSSRAFQAGNNEVGVVVGSGDFSTIVANVVLDLMLLIRI